MASISRRESPPQGGEGRLYSEFDIEISEGLTPMIAWEGGPASSLSVVEDKCDVMVMDRWAIFTQGGVGFRPPVTYGELPPNAYAGTLGNTGRVLFPLEAGKSYIVVLFRCDGLIAGRFFRR